MSCLVPVPLPPCRSSPRSSWTLMASAVRGPHERETCFCCCSCEIWGFRISTRKNKSPREKKSPHISTRAESGDSELLLARGCGDVIAGRACSIHGYNTCPGKGILFFCVQCTMYARGTGQGAACMTHLAAVRHRPCHAQCMTAMCTRPSVRLRALPLPAPGLVLRRAHHHLRKVRGRPLLLVAARTLNATGQSRVTLSLR